MTPDEFNRLLEEMRFDLTSLSLELSTPYRTLQNYRAGLRRIPADFAGKMRQAHQRDRRMMAAMGVKLDRELAILYPQGIPSEREADDHENFY